MKRLSSILGASAGAIALSCTPTPGARAFFTADDRAVMAVVVPPSADAGARDTLLVRNQTGRVDTSLMAVLDTVSILAPGLLRDFQVQNPVSLALGPGSLGARRIRTTSGDSVVHLWRTTSVGPSLATLSRVGFSKDKSHALIHVWFRCAMLCGQGEFILLERTPAGWTVRARYGTVLI